MARSIIDVCALIDDATWRAGDALESYPQSVRDELAAIRRLSREVREAALEQRKHDREFYLAQRRAG